MLRIVTDELKDSILIEEIETRVRCLDALKKTKRRMKSWTILQVKALWITTNYL